MRILLTRVFIIAAIFYGTNSMAQQVALWDFETNLTTTTVDVNGTTGGVTYNVSGYSVVSGNGGGSGAGFTDYTTSATIDLNDYIEFSITPNTGYELNLHTISFDEVQGNGTCPGSWAIRSSADGYTADISTGSTNASWTTQTISLSSHTGLTSATTFRIYGYNAGDASGRWDFDNIKILGTVDPSGVILYDFGTGTGTHSSGSSTSFLPQPSDGEDRVRIGSQGGSFTLANPGVSDFGTGTELVGVAPTGSSRNKFQVYDFTGSQTFYMKFSVRLSGASSGYWHVVGGDGSSFSNDGGFLSSQTFFILRWQYSSTGTITTSYHDGSLWHNFSGNPFSVNTNYVVEIFANNKTSQASYSYDGSTETLATRRWDLYVDGSQLGDDLPYSDLAVSTNIDSWMFSGRTSSSNIATIYLDNLRWDNGFGGAVLPVTLAEFYAEQKEETIQLHWNTLSESNNDFFSLEKSMNGIDFCEIGKIMGHGNSNDPLSYLFTDQDPHQGINYYRLKQVDFDGQYTYSQIIQAEMRPASSANVFVYPVPADEMVHVRLNGLDAELVEYTLADVNGKTCLAGKYNLSDSDSDFSISTSQFQGGLYFLTIRSKTHVIVRKIILD